MAFGAESAEAQCCAGRLSSPQDTVKKFGVSTFTAGFVGDFSGVGGGAGIYVKPAGRRVTYMRFNLAYLRNDALFSGKADFLMVEPALTTGLFTRFVSLKATGALDFFLELSDRVRPEAGLSLFGSLGTGRLLGPAELEFQLGMALFQGRGVLPRAGLCLSVDLVRLKS